MRFFAPRTFAKIACGNFMRIVTSVTDFLGFGAVGWHVFPVSLRADI